MKLTKFSILFLLLTVFIGCDKDDDSNDEEDIMQLVENFVTPQLIQSLTDLGFNFNDGPDLPDISGTFLLSRSELVASNFDDGFAPGTLFSDVTFSLTNLDPDNRTFDLVITENSAATGDVQATFYSGNGSQFSAYARSTTIIGDLETIVLYAISGTITEDGITNAQYALLMLDDDGDPNEVIIEIGEGRLFKDSDGTAERQ